MSTYACSTTCLLLLLHLTDVVWLCARSLLQDSDGDAIANPGNANDDTSAALPPHAERATAGEEAEEWDVAARPSGVLLLWCIANVFCAPAKSQGLFFIV